MFLSVDLGRNAGFAFFNGKDFSLFHLKNKGKNLGEVAVIFSKFVEDFLETEKVDHVVFEEFSVYLHKSQSSVNLYYGLRAILLAVCYKNNIQITGMHPNTVRKFFIGKCKGKKGEIKKLILEKCIDFGVNPLTFDEADAFALLKVFIQRNEVI